MVSFGLKQKRTDAAHTQQSPPLQHMSTREFQTLPICLLSPLFHISSLLYRQRSFDTSLLCTAGAVWNLAASIAGLPLWRDPAHTKNHSFDLVSDIFMRRHISNRQGLKMWLLPQKRKSGRISVYTRSNIDKDKKNASFGCTKRCTCQQVHY